MIDVIIPAYNNHTTIEQTLCSLVMQVNRKELQIIISNDGGKDYSDIIKIFSRWLNIKEINSTINQGPGYARNLALKNSNSEYVVFMDADDTLMSSYILEEMKSIMDSNSNICFIMSDIIELQKDLENKYLANRLSPTLSVLFGKMYRRSFLEENNIYFQTRCFTEDLGFNTLCAMYANKVSKEQGVVIYTNDPSYVWTWNSRSFSRNIGEEIYGKQFCIPGYIYNHLEILKKLENDKFLLENYLDLLIIILFTIYFQYNFLLNHMQENKNRLIVLYTEELSRHFFYKYYKIIKEMVSEEEYNQQYTNIFNATQEQQGEKLLLQVTLDDFINLMFSKPINDNLNYLDFEQELLYEKQKEKKI